MHVLAFSMHRLAVPALEWRMSTERHSPCLRASASVFNDRPRRPIALRIAAVGGHLPPRVVYSDELDLRTNMPEGWTLKHTGVAERRYVGEETVAEMGADALRQAMEIGGWAEPPRALISASAVPQQPIPCTAALIAREMAWGGVPCFDVNATCLGFVLSLQVAGALLAAGTHERMAIVCAEIASKGLNWKQPESAGLMGDGAAAVLIETGTGDSLLLGSLLETWPEGATTAEIRGGGSKLPPSQYRPGENTEDFLFHMDGASVFRLASEKMEAFVEQLVGNAATRWNEIDWVIPHQASLPAIRHLARRLGIPSAKVVETIQQHGNVIAASMPLALHALITSGRLQRGQTVLFLGTAAGFSLGGALVVY
jgi:3-oxoacyl-[acyl-carrier-protein] synthase-3